jgi:hypothetical protein
MSEDLINTKYYSYKNGNYQLKPITLDVLAGAVPMLVKFRKLQQKYTADINMKAIESARVRISELNISIKQLKQNCSEPETGENDINARIAELEQNLKAANELFDSDENLQSTLKLYNECLGLAMLELIGDVMLVKPFLMKVLIPVEGSSVGINVDLQEPEAVEFVRDVASDFFAHIAGARKKSAG